MILQTMGVRRFSNTVKELRNAKPKEVGVGMAKVLGSAVVMLASPLLSSMYKQMMEDFSGESRTEKAAKLKENAIAFALIAHNATGSTGGRANEKIKNYLNGNPTLVASVLSKMSSKEERKRYFDGCWFSNL